MPFANTVLWIILNEITSSHQIYLSFCNWESTLMFEKSCKSSIPIRLNAFTDFELTSLTKNILDGLEDTRC